MINHELQSEWKTLTSIKQIIFNLNNENITQSFNSLIDIIDYDYIYSFNLIVCQMAYEFLIINIKYFDAYLSLIIKIEKWEEKYGGPNIFTICKQFLLNKNTKESYYFLEKMIERNFCGLETKQIQTNPYFVHYMSEIEMQRLSNNVYMKQIIENYEKLSKNNWELHKQLIEEGNNPNEISKIIRNDEIEKLQEISLQNNFDFNQTIEPSLYERCSFIQYNVTLIDYAAFFSSVKCFKYLLMNNAKVNNTGKYAIAGGNEEIIHLCEQNHSTFKSAYETAIMFHRNDIFKYIYENKLDKSTNLEELGKKCVLHHNYEVLSFLLKEGIEINDKIINETARIGNIFLIQDFIQENSIPNVLLLFVAESGNIELFKYIKENKEIDINTKNIFIF